MILSVLEGRASPGYLMAEREAESFSTESSASWHVVRGPMTRRFPRLDPDGGRKRRTQVRELITLELRKRIHFQHISMIYVT